MKFIEQTLGFFNKIAIIIGGIAVLALMSLATINVCFRIFGMPYRGTYELVSFLGAVVTAFALGFTQKRRSHIVVDILTDHYPEKLKRFVESIGFVISMVFFAIIAWVIFRWGLQIAHSGEVSETLKIIYYPFIFCVSIGFLILSFTLLVDFLNTLFIQGENK
jgi:TRAP-type C4-dicarboxylate transport system permease small subunit